jgi:signal transduction histidine kinase
MTPRRGARVPRWWLRWVVAGVAVSAIALAWLAYRAISGWQRSATLVAQRNADAAVDLLATALIRDMRGVQTSVLSTLSIDDGTGPALLDLNAVSSAFARYPYPELFFAGRGAATSVRFYVRADRRPSWLPVARGQASFPVAVAEHPQVVDGLLGRVDRDIADGKRFSAFDVRLDGVTYQVFVQLDYADEAHGRVSVVRGFMVNVDWIRQHYFRELAAQVGRIRGADRGIQLAVIDATGEALAGVGRGSAGAPSSTRQFPLLFFDPVLVELERPGDLAIQTLTARALVADDRGLMAARQGSWTTLALVAASALALVGGLLLTVRAAEANARLVTMRSDFVSAVTHELKTPVATIRAISETVAAGRSTNPDAIRDYALLAAQESKRLTRLIDNLLAYSRLSDVTQAYTFEPVRVGALVALTLKEFDAQLRTGGFRVDVDVADALTIMADTTAMMLAIGNLIDNAIRYSTERRELRIAARALPPLVRLDVSDAGRGIPADEIEQVTRRFFRGQASRSGGSGLGLWIAKRIVSDHGGSLAIASTPGDGTTVTITLGEGRVDDEEADSGR